MLTDKLRIGIIGTGVSIYSRVYRIHQSWSGSHIPVWNILEKNYGQCCSDSGLTFHSTFRGIENIISGISIY